MVNNSTNINKTNIGMYCNELRISFNDFSNRFYSCL